MRNKNWLTLGTTLAGILALPALSLANEKGNGGGAFVCRNASGTVLSSELVDMYEAKNQLGLKIRDFRGMSIEEQIEIVSLKAHRAVDAKKADADFAVSLDASLEQVRKIVRIVDNVSLENTNDFQISISPKSCTGGKIGFEQLASYTPTGDLIVDQEIYDKLSTTDKAALYVHEALYLMAREKHGSESSLEARWANGYLFSTTEATNIPKKALSLQPSAGSPNKKWVCKALFINHSCMRESLGCHVENRYESEEKNTLYAYGKTQVEAAAQFRNYIENNSSFTACLKWTVSYVTSSSDYRDLHYTCSEPATVENACYQQF